MSYYTEETTFLGQPATKAGNEEMEMILVHGWGSNLLSLRYKPLQAELLRVPRTKEEYLQQPILYGTPILFPPNRIGGGTFTWEGRTYRFPINEPERGNHIHGFVYNQPWKLVQATAEKERVILETEWDSSPHPEVLSYFPHFFSIRMIYTLEGTTLHQSAVICNNGQEAFPWGLGYHTAFRFPISPEGLLSQCLFSLTAKSQWKLGERLLPTGEAWEPPTLSRLREGSSLEEWQMDDLFRSSVHEVGRNEAMIFDQHAGLKVIYQCDSSFKHWCVYNGNGEQGFVCPEPYTWMTDAPNVDLPAAVTGLQALNPGEQVKLDSRIVVLEEDHSHARWDLP